MEKTKRRLRKILIISIILMIVLLFLTNDYQKNVAEQKIILNIKIDYYQNIIDIESDWLKTLQLPDNSFAFIYREGEVLRVNPYFADYTAMALIRSDKDRKNVTEVRNYLDWHFSHLNSAKEDINGVDGTIYEYNVKVEDGVIVSQTTKEKYDSVDSYAASFLALLCDYYETTGDNDYILKNYNDITRIMGAIDAVMDDGLTYSKPDYLNKYLMDNAEVYEGLDCLIELYDNVFLQRPYMSSKEKSQVP